MRAQQLLNGGVIGLAPATGQAAKEAFERAWMSVAHQYAGDAQAAEKARVTLAECVLAVTRDGDTDIDQIERLALMMFRTSTKSSPGRGYQPKV
ncbi:MAG TPA: hypothetical protein VJ740_17360 [Hyphomicrobiaceae bacterium]|nr:hypothetical protein [Hyphomicrobiaceae bacterium]